MELAHGIACGTDDYGRRTTLAVLRITGIEQGDGEDERQVGDGAGKRAVYEQAKAEASALPVAKLLSQDRTPVRVFWAA